MTICIWLTFIYNNQYGPLVCVKTVDQVLILIATDYPARKQRQYILPLLVDVHEHLNNKTFTEHHKLAMDHSYPFLGIITRTNESKATINFTEEYSRKQSGSKIHAGDSILSAKCPRNLSQPQVRNILRSYRVITPNTKFRSEFNQLKYNNVIDN